MKKIVIFLSLILVATSVQAVVTTNTVPTSLVTSPATVPARGGRVAFEFALTGDASETLSSVAVTVNSSTAIAADFASVSVYIDDADGTFDSGDMLAGTNAT